MIQSFHVARPLFGGALIGLSAASYLVLNGRVAGISGLVGGLLTPERRRDPVRIAFLLGLLLAPLLLMPVLGESIVIRNTASLPVLAVAGLLVGYGTRLGSGCTSGHGVCGLARQSPRSMAAVGVFMATAVMTVAAMHRFGS